MSEELETEKSMGSDSIDFMVQLERRLFLIIFRF